MNTNRKHTTACTERALGMARENGAPDAATAEAWVAMWDGDGGRDNYGACTCEGDGRLTTVTFSDLAQLVSEMEEV